MVGSSGRHVLRRLESAARVLRMKQVVAALGCTGVAVTVVLACQHQADLQLVGCLRMEEQALIMRGLHAGARRGRTQGCIPGLLRIP